MVIKTLLPGCREIGNVSGSDNNISKGNIPEEALWKKSNQDSILKMKGQSDQAQMPLSDAPMPLSQTDRLT